MSITQFRGEYRFLSNFWTAPFVLDGVVYASVEHAFQAAKAENPLWSEWIRQAPTSGEAKRRGRLARRRTDWEYIKLGRMYRCVEAKFLQHENLKQRLLATGQRQLVEGNNWHDNTFGNCTCQRCAHIQGENHLGKMLMKIRGKLRNA